MAIFEGIGKISDYTHLRSLRREMKYHIKTGTSLAQAMGTPVQPGEIKRAAKDTGKSRCKSRGADPPETAAGTEALFQGQAVSQGEQPRSL